ncbi:MULTISPECIES: glycosyltransferase family 9 protein [unclassified Roseibium]|uniref:glycosyltransferase family 9 protein n=1 Tax=unclassified Roseibium TaxID=2629323 RepID=UPI00273FF741|nr:MULTISPECIES: glycosyltransferase family 9 protein [unclassified Roseibium]
MTNETGSNGVHFVFRVFLGRAASPQATVLEMARWKPKNVVGRVLESKEFRTKVLPGIISNETLPHDPEIIPDDAIDWITEQAKIPKENKNNIKAASTSRTQLILLLQDSSFCEYLLEEKHLSILKKLNEITPNSERLEKARDRNLEAEGIAKELLDAGSLINRSTSQKAAEQFSYLYKTVLADRIKDLFQNRDWRGITEIYPIGERISNEYCDMLLKIARAYTYEGRPSDARTILSQVLAINPEDGPANFYSGVAYMREANWEMAYPLLQKASAISPENAQYMFELGRCRLRFGLLPENTNTRNRIMEESLSILERAERLDSKNKHPISLDKSHVLIHLKRFTAALSALDWDNYSTGQKIVALNLRSRIELASNDVKGAIASAQEILAIQPDHQGAQYQVRALKHLVDDEIYRPLDRISLINPISKDVYCLSVLGKSEDKKHLASSDNILNCFSNNDIDWIIIADFELPQPGDNWFEIFKTSIPGWAGLVRVPCPSGSGWCEAWRVDALLSLGEVGLLDNLGELANDLKKYRSFFSMFDMSLAFDPDTLRKRTSAARHGTVVLMSRHGVTKFGGGEHFLHSMCEHYEALGYNTITVGTTPERVGEAGINKPDGRHFAFIEDSSTALRRFVFEHQVRLIHVLSGLGYEAVEATRYFEIPVIYGVHFWRDCLGSFNGDTEFFRNFDREPITRADFRNIVRGAVVYGNSQYTQSVLEEGFSFRPPVIYSVPNEVQPDNSLNSDDLSAEVIGDLRDYVLLVNTRAIKGFDLILETAELCPEIQFVAIASQSDLEIAISNVKDRGLSNVTILNYTEHMDVIYRHSRVVAVPSYKFIETFSRVCIEAQRYGKPVIGSDKGNVPFLLRDSGVVLPEDAKIWSDTIKKVYTNKAFHKMLSDRALENSNKFSYSEQQTALRRIESAAISRILIGIGSGIGNMLHVGPMIRRISEHFSCQVDIVVAEDHSHSLFLLQNQKYVNSVYCLDQNILRRKYDVVFVTHSFGAAVVPFQANFIVHSRDWRNFTPGGELHETIFNLEAAKTLLGVDYSSADIHQHFIGNELKSIPSSKLDNKKEALVIGIHGGSKDGFWVSKRWPYFEELANLLIEDGHRVASFGVEAEYVPNTENLTGGSIEQMVQAMRYCDYFVSNDSGLMNIAHALGIPTLGLFGPTNPGTRAPLGRGSKFVSVDRDCAPCEVKNSKYFLSGSCNCIKHLPLEKVYDTIKTDLCDYKLKL